MSTTQMEQIEQSWLAISGGQVQAEYTAAWVKTKIQHRFLSELPQDLWRFSQPRA